MTVGRAILIWACLWLLLGVTVALAYIPMGWGNTVASIGIAAIQAALILLFYMNQWGGRPLERLAMGTLVLWLAILISLVFVDYLTRPAVQASPETNLPPLPAGVTQP